jgi:hypothetical protein
MSANQEEIDTILDSIAHPRRSISTSRRSSTHSRSSSQDRHGKITAPVTPRVCPLAVHVEPADAEQRKVAIYTEAFNKYDIESSGHIDTDGFKNLISDLSWSLTDDEIAEAIAELDTSGNGRIELDEFLNWSELAWKFAVSRRISEPGTPKPPRVSAPSPSMHVAVAEDVEAEAEGMDGL